MGAKLGRSPAHRLFDTLSRLSGQHSKSGFIGNISPGPDVKIIKSARSDLPGMKEQGNRKGNRASRGVFPLSYKTTDSGRLQRINLQAIPSDRPSSCAIAAFRHEHPVGALRRPLSVSVQFPRYRL